MLIDFKKITKKYRTDKKFFTAISNFNLKVEKGDFLIISGPSGSGKTTLLNIIGFLDKASSGSYYLEGKNVDKFNDSIKSRLRNELFGFVFQEFNLIENLNVKENILLPLVYNSKKKNKEKINKRLKLLLENLGIKEIENNSCKNLSGGEKQRVAIARALINNPEIILADEPTGNLDSLSGENLMNILLDLNRKKKITIIMVTHNEKLTKKVKNVIKIEDGKLQNK